MAYATQIGQDVVIRSSNLRLTRGVVLRKHAVVSGGAEALRGAYVLEDRTLGVCDVYANSRKIDQTRSLSAAYAVLRGLMEENR